MPSKANPKPKIASNLSFYRHIEPGEGLMYATAHGGGDWEPIPVREKSVRGTKAHRPKRTEAGIDWAKVDRDAAEPNPQTVEHAILPPGKDTLVVQFPLKIFGGVGLPHACNDQEVAGGLAKMRATYMEGDAVYTLGNRYAANIANGRWLWRNLMGAEDVTVHVEELQGGATVREWFFDAATIPFDSFRKPDPDVVTLGEVIGDTLRKKGTSVSRPHAQFRVTGKARIGGCHEVYPSQLMALEEVKGKGHLLHKIGGQAAMTSQKIGNAIRHIDTWHGNPDFGPIAVEPFGSVTSMGVALRPRETNFYSIFDAWVGGEEPPLTDQHFVMAVLIRGTVAGGKDDA